MRMLLGHHHWAHRWAHRWSASGRPTGPMWMSYLSTSPAPSVLSLMFYQICEKTLFYSQCLLFGSYIQGLKWSYPLWKPFLTVVTSGSTSLHVLTIRIIWIIWIHRGYYGFRSEDDFHCLTNLGWCRDESARSTMARNRSSSESFRISSLSMRPLSRVYWYMSWELVSFDPMLSKLPDIAVRNTKQGLRCREFHKHRETVKLAVSFDARISTSGAIGAIQATASLPSKEKWAAGCDTRSKATTLTPQLKIECIFSTHH